MFHAMEKLRAAGRACRCRDAAMAHRRPLVRRQSLRAAAGGALLVAMVAGSVVVSGEVTRLRARVSVLEDQDACLEAESADLSQRWVQATAPDVVIPRAQAIGLEQSEIPDFVLVAAPHEAAAGDGFLARVLSGLAGGATANAAQPPEFVAGAMVSLDPLDRAGGRREAVP